MYSSKTSVDTINRTVWKACDSFRGVIDPSQYKDYILAMLFLKYVSDMYASGVHLPPNCHFDYLYAHREDARIGELMDAAFKGIEKHNFKRRDCKDGSGMFRNIRFDTLNLGEDKERNARLKNLIEDFAELQLDPTHLENNDVIGDAYMYLLSTFASESGKKAGEFYSPPEVSTLLARLTQSKPGASICDPTCGTGSLLIKAGKEVGCNDFSLYGQEVNGNTWALARMNMFLHGIDHAVILRGDTLRNPKFVRQNKLMKFDTVVANPPFSLDKWGAENAESDEFGRFWRGVPPKSKGDWAFICHMIETAKEKTGKVGVVIPHGVLFRGASEGRIRRQTIEENLVEAVIGLPCNLFFGTGIPAAIILFNKGKQTGNVLFIDASREFEKGKRQNRLRPQDVEHIVATYRRFVGEGLPPGVIEEQYAFVATPEDIQTNDYSLNISNYVKANEQKSETDIHVVQKEIERMEAELAEVQASIKACLRELGICL